MRPLYRLLPLVALLCVAPALSAAPVSSTVPGPAVKAAAKSAAKAPSRARAASKPRPKATAAVGVTAPAIKVGPDDPLEVARKAWLTLSPEAARLTQWIRISSDHGDAPFAIIDKANARLYVFDRHSVLRGSAPVLLGSAKGDHTVPGIGEKAIEEVLPHERTTPAGRFVAEHGSNARGEHVLWLDYEAAVSMHPVLTTKPQERRLQRLATPTPADNRISYGCINVPKAFFEKVVLKTLSAESPVIYVIPEVKAMAEVFAGFPSPEQAQARNDAPAQHAVVGEEALASQ